MVLENNGCEVDCAKDGLEALNKIKNKHYDLLVTDIIMPKIEGIELIDMVIELAPNIKIIAMTAEGQAGHTSFLTLAETVGANASLKKPFTPSELLKTIEKTGLRTTLTA
tara:strand:- start:790 stop:1119 length:330 start_codon:yes stop_codon:yes gene_type:complete